MLVTEVDNTTVSLMLLACTRMLIGDGRIATGALEILARAAMLMSDEDIATGSLMLLFEVRC